MEIRKNGLLQTIITSYKETPRDVVTTPTRGKPVWFFVWVENNNLFVEPAHSHIHKSGVSAHPLDKQNVDKIFELYCKRGLLPRADVAAVTHNSSYWFGIFDDLRL